MYLENNRSRHRKTWEIGLDELKEMLNCTAETYDRYKYFNDAILKKCHKELNEKTDCHFDYEPVKRGRAIIGVQFTIKSLAELIVEDVAALPEAPMAEDPSRPLWGSALQDWKLSTEQTSWPRWLPWFRLVSCQIARRKTLKRHAINISPRKQLRLSAGTKKKRFAAVFLIFESSCRKTLNQGNRKSHKQLRQLPEARKHSGILQNAKIITIWTKS